MPALPANDADCSLTAAGQGLASASCSALCPECGSDALYGPTHEYWGVICVECLHEIIPDEMKKDVDGNQNER